MEKSWYSFDVSPLWLAGAFIAALVLSFLLYSKKNTPWNHNSNMLMAFLRFSAMLLLLILLLNPLLQLNQNEVEKAIVVLAVDNSESIPLRSTSDQLQSLKKWEEQAGSELSSDYRVETIYLEEHDSIAYKAKVTNIDQLLRSIDNLYEGENLSAVVLASDGIINQGQSPAFRNYSFPVYTLGLGDTIPPRDIVLTDIRNNKVAYQGNQYPIQVNLQQKGFDEETVTITVTESGKRIATQRVQLNSSTLSIPFLIEAAEPGLKRLSVGISPLTGESSTDNNRQDVFIDVIEGKEKVLLLAQAPHPDIKAIRSVLTEAANYETVLYIPGVSKNRPNANDFDLIIEHQAFKSRQFEEFESNGRWYIADDQINFGVMNSQVSFISVQSPRNQKDQVKPLYNKGFSKFTLTDKLLNRLTNYPPVSVPFGTYEVTGPTEALFYQQIGNVGTERPLMVFFDDGTKKQAVQLGAGFWQWKLQEAGSEDEAALFKEFVLKTVQYLSIKANKDRFITKPRKTDYVVGDRIFIDTEVYNDIYERAYGNAIVLTVTDENGVSDTYEMVDSPANSSFNLGTRSAGVYQYAAATSLGGTKFTEKGSFAVRNIQLESINLAADHNMLRTLSKNTGGQFYHLEDRDVLLKGLIDLDFKDVIRTSEQFIPLISTWWIIIIIASLLSLEWFLRKYLGAY